MPPSVAFDLVDHGCTCGATVIGPARIEALARGAVRTAAVTDPLSAAVARIAPDSIRAAALALGSHGDVALLYERSKALSQFLM